MTKTIEKCDATFNHKDADGKQAVYHTDMQCHVDRIMYDPPTRGGRLYATGYTDMTACIRLFQMIDPAVRQIQTFVRLHGPPYEHLPDTIYSRRSKEDDPAAPRYGIRGAWDACC